MFKDKYKSAMNKITAQELLVSDILNRVNKNRRISPAFLKRPVVAILTLCMCAFIAYPVAAAHSRDIYEIMYFISPEIAQFFRPVQLSCEDNGIVMEVVSTNVKDNEIQVYITMQDVTGDRIDGRIDLNDSYTINYPYDGSGHCSFAGYDDKTGKAVFLITVTKGDDSKIENSKITFSLMNFLSDKSYYEAVEIPVDFENISSEADTFITQFSGGGGTGWADREEKGDIATVLVPGQPTENFSIDGIEVTAAGYVNGKFHIQTAVKDRSRNDNHGLLYLIDKNGNRVNYDYSVSFKDTESSISYDESVFDVPQSEIVSYKLYGDFWTASGYTEGNWSVTFRI